MATWHVVVEVRALAWYDIEAESLMAAYEQATAIWHVSDLQDYTLSGLGWSSDDTSYEIEPQ